MQRPCNTGGSQDTPRDIKLEYAHKKASHEHRCKAFCSGRATRAVAQERIGITTWGSVWGGCSRTHCKRERGGAGKGGGGKGLMWKGGGGLQDVIEGKADRGALKRGRESGYWRLETRLGGNFWRVPTGWRAAGDGQKRLAGLTVTPPKGGGGMP